jgi:hypothetical protein
VQGRGKRGGAHARVRARVDLDLNIPPILTTIQVERSDPDRATLSLEPCANSPLMAQAIVPIPPVTAQSFVPFLPGIAQALSGLVADSHSSLCTSGQKLHNASLARACIAGRPCAVSGETSPGLASYPPPCTLRRDSASQPSSSPHNFGPRTHVLYLLAMLVPIAPKNPASPPNFRAARLLARGLEASNSPLPAQSRFPARHPPPNRSPFPRRDERRREGGK